MAFPAEGGGFGGGIAGAWVRDDAKTGLPRFAGGRQLAVAPAKDGEGGNTGWVEGEEVGEEVAEWPARVLWGGRGIDESNQDLIGTCEEGVVDGVHLCRVAGQLDDEVGFGVCMECFKD